MKQQDRLNEIESMMDQFSLADILADIVTICDAKADHVLTNWQDKRLARDWQKAYAIIATAHGKVSKLSIPQPR